MTTARLFAIGNRVHYTRRVSRGRSVEFTTMQGKVVALEGGVATVKFRNGRTQRVHVSRLRHDRERTELTDALYDRDLRGGDR